MAEIFPIIQTKLYRPPLQADFIPRTQLLEQFDGWQQRPFTLVYDYAVYGKITLVSSWLESLDYPTAWLSLDEQENDLELFLAYFLACVQTAFPDAVDETFALLEGAELPPLRVLVNSLTNEVNDLPQRLVLVIDDYHVIRQQPQLLISKVWVRYFQYALHAIPPLLERIGTILEDDETARPIQGEVDFFWGNHWYWQGQRARSLDAFSRALEKIPEAHHLPRGEAEAFWSLASQMCGQKEEAIHRVNKWLVNKQALHPSRQTRLLSTLIFIHLLSGELHDAAPLAGQLHAMATKVNNRYVRAWASYEQGHIHYFWNDLDTAIGHFSKAVNDRYILHAAGALDSLVGLIFTSQALGQPDKAEATVSLLLEFAQESNYPTAITIARSCQARLALMQGDLASAVHWLDSADLAPDPGVMFFFLEVPHMTQCRIWLAQGTESTLQEAAKKLAAYRKINETQNNSRQLIDILLLQTLLYQKQSQSEKVLATLMHAITLAEPGGYIRPFLELGPEMVELLVRLTQSGVAEAYIARILAAFPDEMKDERESQMGHGADLSLAATTAIQDPSSSLVEPLTPRELDVLALMAHSQIRKHIHQRL